MWPERPNLRLEGPDLRLKRPDSRPDRLDLRPYWPDFRPNGPDLRPERLDEGGRLNKEQTKSPCVLQDFVPFGAAAQKANFPLKTWKHGKLTKIENMQN